MAENTGSPAASGDSPRRQARPPSFGKRVQLSDEIARYLGEQIMLGAFVEGEHLNIDRLARELDTSATPVREALFTLRSEGFIDVEPRKGFRVAPLRSRDFQDISMLLRDVAGELAARATSALDDASIEHLHALQERMVQAYADGATEELEELDHQFHRTINRASESTKLQWILGVLSRFFPQRSYRMVPGWHQAAMDHAAILQALRERDAEAVRHAVIEHLKVAEAMLLQHRLLVESKNAEDAQASRTPQSAEPRPWR